MGPLKIEHNRKNITFYIENVGNVEFHIFCYRLTATRIRHLASTLFSAVLSTEDRGDLAKLMLHSDHTQQSTYNECVQSYKNIRTSRILYKCLTGGDITKEDMKEAAYG